LTEPGSRERDGFLDQVTPLVITFNEASNIERTLAKLRWARRILVIDSGSTDATLEIVNRIPQAEALHRPFDSFAMQCNFGLSQVETEWALSLDADYELSDDLVSELARLAPDPAVAGYRARFIYRIHGRPLRGSLYPPRTVLYRVNAAKYADEGHGHRVSVAGDLKALRGVIFHDDRKPLGRWIASQQSYAEREAEHLLSSTPTALARPDRIRRAGWPAPMLVFLYVLFLKGCVLNGWAGWLYALQRLLAEVLLAIELADRRLASAAHISKSGS
jgi:glycosyltransferase involved in cell wall biosynthesis